MKDLTFCNALRALFPGRLFMLKSTGELTALSVIYGSYRISEMHFMRQIRRWEPGCRLVHHHCQALNAVRVTVVQFMRVHPGDGVVLTDRWESLDMRSITSSFFAALCVPHNCNHICISARLHRREGFVVERKLTSDVRLTWRITEKSICNFITGMYMVQKSIKYRLMLGPNPWKSFGTLQTLVVHNLIAP